MFLRQEPVWTSAGGGGGRTFGRAGVVVPAAPPPVRWPAPCDLARAVGSGQWWLGLATLALLCAAAVSLAPSLRPLPAAVPAPLAGATWDEARAQAIAPFAFGSRTGLKVRPGPLAVPVAAAPERATVDLQLTVAAGDTLVAALTRAGATAGDATTAAAAVRGAAGEPVPGTTITVTLGARDPATATRAVTRVALRARFDLAVAVLHDAAGWHLQRRAIAVDAAPLRLSGGVGASLYWSARAAGAPPKAIETYLKALASRISFGRDLTPGDRFDLVVERRRAATGETELGGLLLAGLDQPGHRTELVRWAPDGQGEGWYDSDGRFEQRGAIGMPVAGHVTSGFGMRFHPVLGFSRMHKGVDIGAAIGTPVIAVVAGVVTRAGWSMGGYGNFVRLDHGGGFATGYGHMSRIAVAAGQRVARGEVIGYVGSTGLSTGPHLHWEVTRGGQAINPLSLSLDAVSALSPQQMQAFRARVAALRAAKP